MFWLKADKSSKQWVWCPYRCILDITHISSTIFTVNYNINALQIVWSSDRSQKSKLSLGISVCLVLSLCPPLPQTNDILSCGLHYSFLLYLYICSGFGRDSRRAGVGLEELFYTRRKNPSSREVCSMYTVISGGKKFCIVTTWDQFSYLDNNYALSFGF